ncbi:MAG: GtrA family protein, partial [Eubacterium sp.]|nr:GtrA family protein [Eubacterium sp.]
MKELWKKYKEIITYIIFGVLTTVVSWGSYTVFVEMLSMKVFVGNLLSWVCAIVFAYITNKLWVFESKSWKPSVIGKEIVTFVASRGVTGVIEIVCVPLLAKTGFDNLFYGILEKLNISISILFT